MDIRTEKLKLIELLLHTNNPSIIEKISSIFQSEDTRYLGRAKYGSAIRN